MMHAARCALLFVLAGLGATGCRESRPIWREQSLPSGRTVKVTSLHLVWGVEHDERTPAQDCFALEFVYSRPEVNDEAREREARDVFELIRPASEQWSFKTATLAGFPGLVRKGSYDLFVFNRGDDGRWKMERTPRKVFAND